jgi:hypothetical protein
VGLTASLTRDQVLLVHAGRPDPVELAFAEGFGIPVMQLGV